GVLQLGLLRKQSLHLLIRHRLREPVAHGIESLDETKNVADAFHDRGAYVLRRVEFGFLRQKADTDAALRPRLPIEACIDAGHDSQQSRFARAVETQHPDLCPRKKRETDVAENHALRRYHLRYPVHREYVLGHAEARMKREKQPRIMVESRSLGDGRASRVC